MLYGLTIMNWIKKITIEDLNNGIIKDIAIKNGLNDAVLLLKYFSGLRIYIPVYDRKKITHDKIKKEYNGKNLLSLAVKLNINTEQVTKYFTNEGGFKNDLYSNFYIKLIVNKCGKGVANRLVCNFPGEFIYIPKNYFHTIRKKYILSDFDGKNVIELALKYNVSESYIRKIISNSYVKQEQIQLSFF